MNVKGFMVGEEFDNLLSLIRDMHLGCKIINVAFALGGFLNL